MNEGSQASIFRIIFKDYYYNLNIKLLNKIFIAIFSLLKALKAYFRKILVY